MQISLTEYLLERCHAQQKQDLIVGGSDQVEIENLMRYLLPCLGVYIAIQLPLAFEPLLRDNIVYHSKVTHIQQTKDYVKVE